ncbi:MAG: acetoacetate decarboxylase family protein, partial [Myxococcota bacterium]|nr:acetoacetate decarboxylase family protein [Myxococcota bacterium]
MPATPSDAAPRTAAVAPRAPRTFLGRTVTLPVEVRDARAATAAFPVDAEAARRWLPDDTLDVVRVWPGRTLLGVGAIDYRDNDLGDYDEIAITLFVRPRAAGRSGVLAGLGDLLRGRVETYIHRLPVNQEFTCEAGRGIWGFPKTVDAIDLRQEDGRVVCDWAREGRPVLRFEARCGGRRTLPDQTLVTWTRIDGRWHRTRFTQGGEDAAVRPG